MRDELIHRLESYVGYFCGGLILGGLTEVITPGSLLENTIESGIVMGGGRVLQKIIGNSPNCSEWFKKELTNKESVMLFMGYLTGQSISGVMRRVYG